MNCKKYRACLAGVIAAALIAGMFIYMRSGNEGEIPVDGTLVERETDYEEDGLAWA